MHVTVCNYCLVHVTRVQNHEKVDTTWNLHACGKVCWNNFTEEPAGYKHLPIMMPGSRVTLDTLHCMFSGPRGKVNWVVLTPKIPFVFLTNFCSFWPSWSNPFLYQKKYENLRKYITFLSPLRGSPSSIVAPRVTPQSYFLLQYMS
jgi:hypothetical protein